MTLLKKGRKNKKGQKTRVSVMSTASRLWKNCRKHGVSHTVPQPLKHHPWWEVGWTREPGPGCRPSCPSGPSRVHSDLPRPWPMHYKWIKCPSASGETNTALGLCRWARGISSWLQKHRSGWTLTSSQNLPPFHHHSPLLRVNRVKIINVSFMETTCKRGKGICTRITGAVIHRVGTFQLEEGRWEEAGLWRKREIRLEEGTRGWEAGLSTTRLLPWFPCLQKRCDVARSQEGCEGSFVVTPHMQSEKIPVLSAHELRLWRQGVFSKAKKKKKVGGGSEGK